MNLKRMLVLLLAGGMLLLSGCNFPTVTVVPAPKLVCPSADLVAPTLKSPPSNVNMGPVTTVILAWVYEGVAYPYPEPAPTPSKEYGCHPTKYRISLSTAPLFADELGAEVPAGTISGDSWTTPVLQSGQTYRWSVVAVSQGVNGPPSQTRYFSVGASCDVASLKAPILVAPLNGSTVATLTPQVKFQSTMTCLPSDYLISYSQDSTLATSDNIGGGFPGYYGYGMPLPQLKNCATYYWRVAARVWTAIGPYSDIWSFKVQAPELCNQILHISPIELPTIPPISPGNLPPLQPGPNIWKVVLNANCRAGPGTVYNETGFTPAGYEAQIEGRNEDGSWFRLMDPNGMSCWVSKIALEVPDNWAALPVLAYPAPPPTQVIPTPSINCAKYSYLTCTSHPACSWNASKETCVNK